MALTTSIRAGVIGGDFEKQLAQASQKVRAEGRTPHEPGPRRPAQPVTGGADLPVPTSPEALVLQRARDLINRARPATADEDELRRAAHAGEVDLVAELLEAGVDPSAADPVFLVTPLSLSAASGRNEIVRLLICAGADLHATSLDGRTALQSARLSRAPQSTVALLESLASKAPGRRVTSTSNDGGVQALASVDPGTTRPTGGSAAGAETTKAGTVRSTAGRGPKSKTRGRNATKRAAGTTGKLPEPFHAASEPSAAGSRSDPTRCGSRPRDPKLRGMIRFVDTRGWETLVHKSLVTRKTRVPSVGRVEVEVWCCGCAGVDIVGRCPGCGGDGSATGGSRGPS